MFSIIMRSIDPVGFHQYFADRDVFCAGRVTEEDLHRVAAATGGTIQTTVNNVIDEVQFFLYITCQFSWTEWKTFPKYKFPFVGFVFC